MTDFNKSLQIKFHENLSNWSQVIPLQTDGLTDDEANCCFLQLCQCTWKDYVALPVHIM